jgi:hypothetical protein
MNTQTEIKQKELNIELLMASPSDISPKHIGLILKLSREIHQLKQGK